MQSSSSRKHVSATESSISLACVHVELPPPPALKIRSRYMARSQLRVGVGRSFRPSTKFSSRSLQRKTGSGDCCGLDRLIAAHSLPVNALLMASATTDVTD
eukprot:6214166-Pleurochrysis_carterae.AAC.5